MVKRYGLTLLLLTLFLGVLFAVYHAMQEEDQEYSYSTYEYVISPRFREFYEQLGGEEVLGIGISSQFNAYGKEYQYVVAGLMRFDPSMPDGQQFSLSAIGREMGIDQSEYLPPEEANNNQFRNGFPIYNKFLDSYYTYLDGPKFAGEPLSGPILDPDSNRMLQYFENIGFYINEDDPESQVRLLPYGVWMCKEKCLTEGSIDPVAIVSESLMRDTLFKLKAQELNGIAGEKLSPIRDASDGNIEQVYENIVLFADRRNKSEISIRPLTEILGYSREEPVLPTTINKHRFIFTSDDVGFHINENVYQFIEMNGGQEVFGAPIQQPKMVAQDVWQQCFVNICLEYVGNGQNIQVLSLGNEYYSQSSYSADENFVNLPIIITGSNRSNDQPAPVAVTPVEEKVDIHQELTATPEYKIDIQSEVQQELITSVDEQLILITISMDGKPLEAINTEVVIRYPGGAVDKFYPSITDLDGQSSLRLKPISAPNGTRIEYSVCLLGGSSDAECVQNDFLIWGNSP